MITTLREIVYDQWSHDIRCLSTDTKPTVHIANGASCIEVDTGNIFFYDAEHEQWYEFDNTIDHEVWTKFKAAVSDGSAKTKHPVGSQVTDKWYENASRGYDAPWDVVHYDTSGDAYLIWHYGIPTEISFDAREALFYAPEGGIPAGQYYVEAPLTDWQVWKEGICINFILSQPMEEGDQFVLNYDGLYSRNPIGSKWGVFSKGSTILKDAGVTTDSKVGTKLGETSRENIGYTNGIVNSHLRVDGGYNRYSQSAVRQYLNSRAKAGEWWKPQNPWDRPPRQHDKVRGFLAGFSTDFLNTLEPVSVITGLNGADAEIEGKDYETTEDLVFLPSLTELNIEPDVPDEGIVWSYYKNLAAEHSMSQFKRYTFYNFWKMYKISGEPYPENEQTRSTAGYKNIYRAFTGDVRDLYPTPDSAYCAQPAIKIRKENQ